ncbi:hypothetical protein [Nocardia sp. NPDC003963]
MTLRPRDRVGRRPAAPVGRILRNAPAVGALDDPFSAEGLALCEQAIRDRFGSIQAINDPENTERADRFGRCIGEVHRRATEARWVNSGHMYESAGPRPQLIFPFSEWAFDAHDQVGGAFAEDPYEPTQLVWVLNNMRAEHERPSVEEYRRRYLEQLVAETDGNDL